MVTAFCHHVILLTVYQFLTLSEMIVLVSVFYKSLNRSSFLLLYSSCDIKPLSNKVRSFFNFSVSSSVLGASGAGGADEGACTGGTCNAAAAAAAGLSN